MNSKLDVNFIRTEFKKEEYTLLSEMYINNKTKLYYTCSKNHKHSITWNDWQQGNRCPSCYGNSKPTLEYIKEVFEKEGYVLLESEYKNAHTKLNFICNNNHKHSISWLSWQHGRRCYYCSRRVKPTIEQVKDSFEEENYILLSEMYKSNATKLDYICSEGHEHSIIWSAWRNGHRCPYCAGVVKPTIEEIKKSFNNEGYELLSKEYKNTFGKLYYICYKGHAHNMGWGSWKNGHRCPTCAYVVNSLNQMGNKNHQWQGGLSYEPYCPIWKDKEYKQDIKLRDGYKCLNPYCYSKNPNDLNIHHIDYNKKNCHPSNLITVCRTCNISANSDRDWHQTWYQAIIKNRYNYGGVKCP